MDNINTMKIKFLLLILISLLITSHIQAHRDTKHIQEGVIHPSECDTQNTNPSIDEIITCGQKNGFYIKSTARRYDIRNRDKGLIINFLKNYRTTLVRAQLLINSRNQGKEIWTIIKLRTRE